MPPSPPAHGRNPRRWILAALLGFAAIAVFAAYLVFFGPNSFSESPVKVFFVSRGQSFQTILDSLEHQGIIRNRTLIEIVARVYGGAERIQVGKYRFESGISNADLFLTLRSGRGNQLIVVTIPEGYRARAQARIFARSVDADTARYMQLVRDPAFAGELGLEAPTLEGYLLPDSYGLYWEQDEKDILRRQVSLFKMFFTDTLAARAKELGWTVHQAVTFASIVEGEAVLDEERPVIAGVYHNRLRLGMRLEADPTIQYILPDGPRRVLYADLRLDNPYNTYRYAGLPPGPVNNPGRSSILASLYPSAHSYIFFVANGRGGHWFSRNYTEHQQYVRKFRRERSRQREQARNPTPG
jgi:UPF0755 protein